MNKIDLLTTMRIFTAGMRLGNERTKLAAFDTISDEIDTWADRLETILADRDALVEAAKKFEKYDFGFPEVPEPECDALRDALADLENEK